jgi:nucleotide-binding universal stress UspA family protein
MKVLLPVDLVQPIEPTLDLLNVLCNLKEADVNLLYVRELLPAYESVIKTSGNFSDDWEKKLEATAKERLQDFQQALKPHCRTVTIEIASGPPAGMICTVAADEEQDLIVLASLEKKQRARFLPGTVSSRVMDQSSVPILLGRPSASGTDGLHNVLIGFDGSEHSRQAVEHACACFRLAEAKPKVTVVHSVDVAEPVKYLSPVEFVATIEQNLLMAGETYLAQAEKILADHGIRDVECCLIEGDPANGILKMADELQVDLIILGSRGHGLIGDLLLGSVSHKVALHATCSAAIFKKAAQHVEDND